VIEKESKIASIPRMEKCYGVVDRVARHSARRHVAILIGSISVCLVSFSYFSYMWCTAVAVRVNFTTND
jgi:hypothetical protein